MPGGNPLIPGRLALGGRKGALAMNLIWWSLFSLLRLFWNQTWMTRIGSPVSLASCSLISRVGFGDWLNTFLRTSNCLALMVVRGPRLLFSLSFLSPSESSSSSSQLLFESSCSYFMLSGSNLMSMAELMLPPSDKSLSIPESRSEELEVSQELDDPVLESCKVVFIWHMKAWSSQ